MKYDFCICSSVADQSWAERLSDSLQKYKLPDNVVLADASLDYRRILLDVDGSPFDESVKARLNECRNMIMICSPGMQHAEPILARLNYFASIRSKSAVVPVIVEGEPIHAFPDFFIEHRTVEHIQPDMSIVSRVETIEPVASDLRGNTPKRQQELLRYETVRIAAFALNLLPDMLEQRHAKRRRQRIIAVASAVSAVLLAVTAVFSYFGWQAKIAGDTARKQTDESVAVIRRLLVELPEAFTGNDQAENYVSQTITEAMNIIHDSGITSLQIYETENDAGGGA